MGCVYFDIPKFIIRKLQTGHYIWNMVDAIKIIPLVLTQNFLGVSF